MPVRMAWTEAPISHTASKRLNVCVCFAPTGETRRYTRTYAKRVVQSPPFAWKAPIFLNDLKEGASEQASADQRPNCAAPVVRYIDVLEIETISTTSKNMETANSLIQILHHLACSSSLEISSTEAKKSRDGDLCSNDQVLDTESVSDKDEEKCESKAKRTRPRAYMPAEHVCVPTAAPDVDDLFETVKESRYYGERAVRAWSVSTTAAFERAEGGQVGEDRETCASTSEALGAASQSEMRRRKTLLLTRDSVRDALRQRRQGDRTSRGVETGGPVLMEVIAVAMGGMASYRGHGLGQQWYLRIRQMSLLPAEFQGLKMWKRMQGSGWKTSTALQEIYPERVSRAQLQPHIDIPRLRRSCYWHCNLSFWAKSAYPEDRLRSPVFSSSSHALLQLSSFLVSSAVIAHVESTPSNSQAQVGVSSARSVKQDNGVGTRATKAGKSLTGGIGKELFRIQTARAPSFEGTKKPLRSGTFVDPSMIRGNRLAGAGCLILSHHSPRDSSTKYAILNSKLHVVRIPLEKTGIARGLLVLLAIICEAVYVFVSVRLLFISDSGSVWPSKLRF
ncbi:hypothetical protein DFH11DRAFT_1548483 [Phellopilus nigrolimitatus]|nr:hypothetical protein DFH11DRAFT_1548483 [Phellopilus nigrolimitatus]